jgi:hypothetical protein
LSPILVRPVREQLEHDRVIRLLQAKLKRKHDVAINVGDDQAAGIKIGPGQMFPDLVLTSQDKAHRLEGVIEVETGESVNHLEAMAQWAHFGRVRAPFHLYVPAGAVDIARRLCTENAVDVAEIWSYHSLGDQTRFTLVSKSAVKESSGTAQGSTGSKGSKGSTGSTGSKGSTGSTASTGSKAVKKAKPAVKKATPAKPGKAPAKTSKRK